MLTLLRIEWLKLKSSKLLLALSILFFSAVAGLCISLDQLFLSIFQKSTIAAAIIQGASFFSFPDIWGNFTALVDVFKFIPGFIIMIIITQEFTYKTQRQGIINGQTHFQVFISKWLLILAIITMEVIIILLATVIKGNIGESGQFWDGSTAIGRFILSQISYFSIVYFVSSGLKKTGITMLTVLMTSYIIEPIIMPQVGDSIDAILPFNVSSALTPFNFKKVMQMDVNVPNLSYIASIVYIIIFNIGNYLLLTKKDN